MKRTYVISTDPANKEAEVVTDHDRAEAVRQAILSLVATLPDSALPKWKVDDSGAIWFPSLSMGWVSASNPERLAEGQIDVMLAAEAASRELLRRAAGAR